MFKSLIAYRISPLWPADLAAIEEALAKSPFIECGATQEKSAGWVPPRGEAHGALVESIGGQWIARLMTETKSVPGSVLARKVAEKAARIEQETGRKPGRKESKELKDEALLDLLPMAFTKQASTWVWIDLTARLLVLDTSSQGRAWDDRVSFVLTEGLQIKKLAFLDSVFEGTKADEGGFDTDVAIATGELRKLIPDLIDALGGESESCVAAALQAKGEAVVEAITSGTTSSWLGEGPDPLYDEAVKTVRAQNKASISLVQRKLRIGYNRAARLLEAMEKAGVVSAMNAGGAREVLA